MRGMAQCSINKYRTDMKKFMDKNFLLTTKTAKKLYTNTASKLPIFDYHCHLDPQEIAENKKFTNLTEIWLGGDHYKWRQMRAAGFSEELITGNAPAYNKFLAWTQTLENSIGNPLYHWTHLELQRYFGIYEPLTTKTAPAIWEKANRMLQSEELSVRGIFEKFNIYAVGTTDDPADSLEWHVQIAAGTAKIGRIKTKIIPSFRPDNALSIEKNGFPSYMHKLESACGKKILSVTDIAEALINRLDFFIANGCKASDHAFDFPPFAFLHNDTSTNLKLLNEVYEKALNNQPVSMTEAEAYKTYLMGELAKAYSQRNIAMQLHLSVIRDTNKNAFCSLGPNTGFDAVHDNQLTEKLSGLLSYMSKDCSLPKTILYSLNPKDYYPLATIAGAFQGDSSEAQKLPEDKQTLPGKIQLGAAWWFLDNKDGIIEQLKTLGNLGMLSSFVGMLTDSRSFLSYPRHEYFRRILCRLIGEWVENGEFPNNMEKLSEIVKNISFYNAKSYFEN